jgi:hypothetical protein
MPPSSRPPYVKPERAGEMIATPSPTYLTRAITISRRRTRRSTRRQQDKQKEECKEPQEGGQNGKLSAGAPISAALDRRRDAGLNPPRSMRVYRSRRGSVRTSAAAHESDHLDHSACSKRQMAAATGPVSSASWPLAQGQCHSGGKLPAAV